MDGQEHRLPLGLCKQAALKLEAFNGDIHEIMEDPDLTDEERSLFNTMIEYSSMMLAYIVNIVHKECGEEDFINEQVPMDELGGYPGDIGDIEDQPIE